MTSPTPTTPPVQPKKPKRSKTNGPIVTLPKAKFPTSVAEYELLDEAARERKEEVAQKTAEEEAKKKFPETNTKPDIFQTTTFLQDDKCIIVNYPKNKREKDINDAYNALNGTRKEASTQDVPQDMPQDAIEVLQRMLGKVPEQKTRGSNYGQLAQDFTFPPRPQSTAGKSKETTKEETAASSSKANEDAKEVDLEEIEKRERARRRKSNLNALAPEFTPSFVSGSSSTDANKSADSDLRVEFEDRKKKNKKEKAVLDTNNDIESSAHYQRKLRKPQMLTSEVSTSLDSTTGSYAGYPSTYEQPPYFVPGPPTPYPPFIENNSSPNWDEYQKNLLTEFVSRTEVEIQKHIEKLMSEIKAVSAATQPEYAGSSSLVSDKKKDDAEKRREEVERKNEEARLKKIQEQLLHELRSSHQETMLRHEEMQIRHLELQAELEKAKDEVQSVSTVQQRHVELQNIHQNLQEKELSQFDELNKRFQEILSEHRKMQDRQHDEMTLSQTLQHRLNEIESELSQARYKNTQLMSENVRLTSDNAKLSDESISYKMKVSQQDLSIDDYTNREKQLVSELTTLKSNLSRIENELNLSRNQIKTMESHKLALEGQSENQRSLQNEVQKLLEENNALIQKNDRLLQSENTLKQERDRLRQSENSLRQSENTLKQERDRLRQSENTLKQERDRLQQSENTLQSDLRQVETDLIESRRLNRDLERNLEQRNADKEDIERQLNELRNHNHQLEAEILNSRKSKEKLESEVQDLQAQIDAQEQTNTNLQGKYNQESVQKNHEIDMLNREVITLRQKIEEHEKIQEQFNDYSQIRHQNQDLKQKVTDLELNLNMEDANRRELESIKKLVSQLGDQLHSKEKEIATARNELSESKKRVSELEAEKNKIILDTRLQMTSTPVASYNSPVQNHRTIDYNLEERRFSRDQIAYNSSTIPNNFDHNNLSPNAYPRQAFNPVSSNNNLPPQNSQPMSMLTSSVNLQHTQVNHSSMQHQPPVNHIQQNQPLNHVQQNQPPVNHIQQNQPPVNHIQQNQPPVNHIQQLPVNHIQQNQPPVNHIQQLPVNHIQQSQPLINHIQPPQGIQSVVPLQISPTQAIVSLPSYTQHQQPPVQVSSQLQQQKMTQMPQQMQIQSQQQSQISLTMPPQSQMQQQTNTSALPSPITSQQGPQSHLVQQQNAKDNKGHSHSNSRNFGSGNNFKQNKHGINKNNKKKPTHDRKNSTNENRNQNNNIDNSANNSKTNLSDPSDAPENQWNKQSELKLTNSTWW